MKKIKFHIKAEADIEFYGTGNKRKDTKALNEIKRKIKLNLSNNLSYIEFNDNTNDATASWTDDNLVTTRQVKWHIKG